MIETTVERLLRVLWLISHRQCSEWRLLAVKKVDDVKSGDGGSWSQTAHSDDQQQNEIETGHDCQGDDSVDNDWVRR